MITIDMVKNAVKKNGFGVCQHKGYDYDDSGQIKAACPVGHLYYAVHGSEPKNGFREWSYNLYGSDYVRGFIDGFDGVDNLDFKDEQKYKSGIIDGILVKVALGF